MSQTAALCIAQFDSGTFGCDHQQSQRFLNPAYQSNNPCDPPLRPAVDLLASGSKVSELPAELHEPMIKWLSAFKLVRTVERTVEGIHSIIGRSLKRAPAAKIAYLSVELRYSLMKPMLRELALNPEARGSELSKHTLRLH